MVRKEYSKAKLCIIVKTYLCLHKGKWCTSREIADFINSNNLPVKKLLINSSMISRIMKERRYYPIFTDVEYDKQGNAKVYRVI